jgi:hypothetical protein
MEEDPMGEMTKTLRTRLLDAYASLRAARETGDDFLADATVAEIENLERIAEGHGIPVPAH